MFEERLKKISNRLGKENLRTYYILTRKKNKREIYFANIEGSIEFIKSKFNTPCKKIIYFLIKCGLLQLFLRKIRLSSKMGHVIFIGGQIKSFDFKNKKVFSFPLQDNESKDFIRTKNIQKGFSKIGFAPKLLKIDKNFPFAIEELLQVYTGGSDEEVFKKLFSLYRRTGIEKTPVKKYADFLLKRLERRGINDPLTMVLKDFLDKDEEVLTSKIHGDFTKEQVLIKNGSYVFIDWDDYEKEIKKNLIVRDLITFFRDETNFMGSKKLKVLLRVYPKEVRKNIKNYLILNEFYNVSRRHKFPEISRIRIKNIIRHK